MNSYGLWIATEINEHYDSDDSRESFIKVAFGRQVASKKPKVLWDLNPCNPKHKIYTDYIDKYKTDFVGGYNYEHFTLHDNLSITPLRLQEIESQYDKDSVWYRRDILGERCVAEGLVYQQYADNPEKYAIDNLPSDMVLYNIGVDFGGNGSATAFVLTGFTRRFEKVIPIFSERHEEELNPEQLNRIFVDFVRRCHEVTQKPMNVYADSAEQILIRGLKSSSARNALPVQIHNARKMPILERIRLVNKLIAQDRFAAYTGAETVKKALYEALWDKKKDDARLDNGSTWIDDLDAMEYSIEPYFNELSRM